MRKFILAAAAVALFPAVASAATLGIAAGVAGSNSSSNVASTSQGGSLAVVAGVTGQASGANAQSSGASGAQIANGQVITESTHNTSTNQGGGAFALGLAGSGNANNTAATGSSNAAGAFTTLQLFLVP